MNITKLISDKAINQRFVVRYLKFIELCVNSNKGNIYYTEKHHLLPSSIYPEYKNFKEYSWNLVHLTPRQHYISHYLLAKAFQGKMWYAFNMMNNIKNLQGRTYNLNSRLYERCKAELVSMLKGREVSLETRNKMSKAKKGKVFLHLYNPCSGQYRKVAHADAHELLVAGWEKGMPSLKDLVWVWLGDDVKRVRKEEVLVYISEGWNRGRPPTSNDTRDKMSEVRKGQTRVFTEEHKKNIGTTVKGKVTVVDTITGDSMRVSVDDPYYLSGRYVHVAKGYKMTDEQKSTRRGWVTAVDLISGITVKCKTDDPRYLSGELMPLLNAIITCPHCGKEGRKNIMHRWHLDNCRHKSNKEEPLL